MNIVTIINYIYQARLQRANTNLKLGLLDVALPDYNHLMVI